MRQQRLAALVLCVVLMAPVTRRPEPAQPRPRRRPARGHAPQLVFATRVVANRRPPYAVDFAACPRRVGRLVRFRPSISPFDLN